MLGFLSTEARAELDRYIDQRIHEALQTERAKRWLTVKETAVYLGISEKAVYHRIEGGRISAKRQGRAVLVDRVALDRAIESS